MEKLQKNRKEVTYECRNETGETNKTVHDYIQ